MIVAIATHQQTPSIVEDPKLQLCQLWELMTTGNPLFYQSFRRTGFALDVLAMAEGRSETIATLALATSQHRKIYLSRHTRNP